jgi:hypothetical protein
MSTFGGWPSSIHSRLPLELELPTRPDAPSSEPIADDGAFVDVGMAIPESYGVDVVRALVQDPFHLMVYWELRAESLLALSALFPDASIERFHACMRLTDMDEGYEAYVAIPLAGKYWFLTMPDKGYRVDVGARSAEYGFVPIVRSNVVRTPRGTVSPEMDQDPRFVADTPRFVKLLAVTGFATDRVLSEVALADAKVEPEARPTPPSATPPPPYLADAFARLPNTVRDAAARVALGELITAELLASLPQELRELLLRLLRDGDYELITAAFMHLLPQLLRRALEGEFVEIAQHPLHLPPRFAIGSSEELARRPRVDWSWMPSMAHTLRRRPPVIEPDPLDP